MTDGRGIKGTSVGFVTRDLGVQNPFFSLVLEATVIAVRAARGPCGQAGVAHTCSRSAAPPGLPASRPPAEPQPPGGPSHPLPEACLWEHQAFAGAFNSPGFWTRGASC